MRKEERYRIVYNAVNRYQSQWSKTDKAEKDELRNPKEVSPTSVKSNSNRNNEADAISKYSSDEDDFISIVKWKPELAWISKALEPALQLWRRALPTGFGLI